MTGRKEDLAALISPGNVLDDAPSLASFSQDESDSPRMEPALVAKPRSSEDVQKIVSWANQTGTPLIPVSSGPPHFRGDSVPGVPGAVVVDLGGMKKILNVNRRNRMAVIEPGVTYSELQPALAQHGMRLSLPLLPRANKSVVGSLLEREPRLDCRFQWSSMEPLRSLEVVWGDGHKLWTGGAGFDTLDLEKQWTHDKWQVEATGPGQTDFCRFLGAAQGSLGIVTWASVRCQVLPLVHQLFFVAAEKLDYLIDFTYEILKLRYADELFLLNRANLAFILGQGPAGSVALMKELPPWAVLVGIAGRSELPEERVQFQVSDIAEIAGRFGLKLAPEIPGARGRDVLDVVTGPSRGKYWKLDYKGGCQEIFFVGTLDRAPEFLETMFANARQAAYPTSDIGVYLQPRHQGVNCHIEFSLPFAPGDPAELSRVQMLFKQASESLFEQGAFFTRPYGIWSDLAFSKDAQSANLLRKIKSIFDPNGVMNPGKLCFKVGSSEVRK
jgi:FAD/FMN-containing dehydrogenase